MGTDTFRLVLLCSIVLVNASVLDVAIHTRCFQETGPGALYGGGGGKLSGYSGRENCCFRSSRSPQPSSFVASNFARVCTRFEFTTSEEKPIVREEFGNADGSGRGVDTMAGYQKPTELDSRGDRTLPYAESRICQSTYYTAGERNQTQIVRVRLTV